MLPSAIGIVEAFDGEGVAGRLLILGAPGSGKTTALLQLAHELARRAENDPGEPMPMLLNLSSWRDDSQSFSAWLVEQLKRKYGVRQDYGRKWLDERDVVPLLDGLDELPPARHEACIRAINQFQQDVRPKYLVVCCRLAEYENVAVKLQLNGAICLLPLRDEQVRDYLVRAGCAGVWQSIGSDLESMDLARSPLLLGMMTVAYGELSPDEWKRLASPQIGARTSWACIHNICCLVTRRGEGTSRSRRSRGWPGSRPSWRETGRKNSCWNGCSQPGCSRPCSDGSTVPA